MANDNRSSMVQMRDCVRDGSEREHFGRLDHLDMVRNQSEVVVLDITESE